MHRSILAWKTPLTEEPGGLQSTGSSCSFKAGQPHSLLCAVLVAGALHVWGVHSGWPGPALRDGHSCCLVLAPSAATASQVRPSGRLRGRTSPSCSQQTVKDVFPGPQADQTGDGRKFSVARNTLFAKFSLQQAKIYNPQGTNLTSMVIT